MKNIKILTLSQGPDNQKKKALYILSLGGVRMVGYFKDI
jgi:hypothetical protein